MRYFCIILIMGIVVAVSSADDALAARGLKLKLTFDKDKYVTTDPIKTNFVLANKGKKPIFVNNRFFINSKDSPKEQREIYLIVISPSGERLPCKISGKTGLPRTDNFVLLQPGEETALERERNIKYYFDFDAPGVYKIQAVYQNVYGAEIGVDAFKGEVKSKELSIEIVEETQKGDHR